MLVTSVTIFTLPFTDLFLSHLRASNLRYVEGQILPGLHCVWSHDCEHSSLDVMLRSVHVARMRVLIPGHHDCCVNYIPPFPREVYICA